jgi:hypothetical protein
LAFLADSRLRALDANGDPLVGATLTIYEANTTTPAAIYSDAALTVPLSNPTSGSDVSDAGGWFPQIFAAEGTIVDITLKNSGGTTVKTYVDVPFVGEDVGDFTRTVSGNGRFKLTGSGGGVSLQAGDADPDNTGGTLTLEGWAGTQLDSLTLDSATTNTTGRLTENGKDLSGVIQTEATTFSAVTSVDIPLTESPDGVRAWKVTIFDFTVTASASVQYKASFDGGATVKSGASDYDFASLVQEASVAVATGDEAAAGGTNVIGDGSITTPTNRPGRIEFEIITPNSGSDSTLIIGRYFLHDSQATPVPCIGMFATWVRGGYGRMTHLRLVQATGAQTMSGKYRVERLYGFGET